MTQITSQCSCCKHFNRQDTAAETCAAFPTGIPPLILTNAIDHRKAVDGDRGIRYARAIDVPNSVIPGWPDNKL